MKMGIMQYCFLKIIWLKYFTDHFKKPVLALNEGLAQ